MQPATAPIQVLEPKLDPIAVMKKIVRLGQEDCFYVCDLSDIVHKHKNWVKAMPRVKTFYAVKCNDSTEVLETLAALGTGFDCASKEEIEKILALGVKTDRIVFANPTKKISHIRYAALMGVKTVTFDNEVELYKMRKYFPKADLVLRIRYDDATARYVLGHKYGADPKTEAGDLLELARFLDLNVIGVSFHIGSSSKNFSTYCKAIAAAKTVFDRGTELGFKMRLLDIGGGYPGEKDNYIDEIGDYINKAIATDFSDESVQIIAEPGRYYVDTAFSLAANIHSMRTLAKPEGPKHHVETNMYYLDISIYGALICTLFDEEYPPVPLFDDPKGPTYPSVVWGATCDVCDRICKNVALPRLKVGDWLAFEKTGAYSITLSTRFNGFATPDVHYIISTEDWLLLTQKVSSPMSTSRFVKGNAVDHFRTGLENVE